VLRYISQNESPQVTFRKHRVPSNELEFKWKPYEKRKQLFIERVSAIINYATTKECRSVFISKYFGDVQAKECGECDNCLHKKASSLSPAEFEKISGMITQTLSNNQLTATQLIEKIKSVRKEKTWKVIEFLQAEDRIVYDKSGILHLK
jgi:ATP-dependent DNA helicase RecQ